MDTIFLKIGEDGKTQAWALDSDGYPCLKGVKLMGRELDLSSIQLESKKQVRMSGLVDTGTGKTIYTGAQLKEKLGQGECKENPILVTGDLLALTPPPSTAPSATCLSREEVKSSLVLRYKSRIIRARTSTVQCGDRDMNGPLQMMQDGKLLRDIGQYFNLKQRKLSFRSALLGTVKIFKAFMTPISTIDGKGEGENEDFWLRQALFLIMIAYPGSGKTTFGQMLRDFLVADFKNGGKCISHCIQKLSPEMQQIFSTMVQDSVVYNLLLYHKLVNDSGHVLHDEENLHPAQILALRVFYAAFGNGDKDNYRKFLRELSPEIRNTLLLSEVLDVIRESLGISSDKRIMFLVFFDEVNAATGKLHRATAGHRSNVTWGQQLFSEYVSFLSANRCGNNFVVLCGATTRFSAGSMEFTETGLTSSVLIPLPPLSRTKALEVLTEFHRRLQLCVGNRKGEATWMIPRHIQDLFELCGGMPRLLSYAVKALVTGDRSDCVAPDALLSALETSAKGANVRRILQNLEFMVIQRVAFSGYTDKRKFPVLERAFAYSLLKRPVQRGSIVMDAHPDTWGDLEAQGVIALDDYAAHQREQVRPKRPCRRGSSAALKSTLRVTSPGTISSEEVIECQSELELLEFPQFGASEALVSFCPIMLKYIVEKQSMEYQILWPDLMNSDWKMKEEADLLTVLFKMRLMKTCFLEQTFRIKDLLPPSVQVPDYVAEWIVDLPSDFQAPSGQLNSSAWAVMGKTNFGFDSLLVLCYARTTKVVEKKRLLLFVESKKRDTGGSVSLASILSKEKDVLNKYANTYEVESEVEFVFLYISDETLCEGGHIQLADLVESNDKWAQRLIVWDRSANDDTPLHALAAFRHRAYLTSSE